MLPIFSGKIPDCNVHNPFSSLSVMSCANNFLPIPFPLALLATYMLTSATPSYTQREDTGESDAHPSISSPSKAANLQKDKWLLSHASHSGASV
jgi:hypothetical protein